MEKYIEIQLDAFSRVGFKTKEGYENWRGSEMEIESRARAEIGRLTTMRIIKKFGSLDNSTHEQISQMDFSDILSKETEALIKDKLRARYLNTK